jgi:hypothetical protein
MKFRSQLMAALEESVGTDDALAVAEVGNLRLGVCSDETGIALLACGEAGWETRSRHETFWGAMRNLATYIDESWEVIPVDDLDDPTPVVVFPETESYKVLFRTTNGVTMATQASGTGRRRSSRSSPSTLKRPC